MKRLLYLAFAAAVACCCSPKPANGSNSPEARADALLDKLTLEQKASLMMNDSPAIDSLGIHEYNWWSEALHGTARNGLATVFPQSIAMASSWDEALLQQVFDIAGNEQRIKFNQWRRDGGPSIYHGLSVWTPNINIFRDPRWGRGQETYGEDPYLTSRMGKAVVDGLQGMTVDGYDRLHACLKHFAVHSGPEHNRHSFNVEDLSMRDLQETYLYAFERLVKTTNVHEVMCAYQRLDSKPCCGNDQFLMYYLREKWGYKGIVVSDCGAIDDFWVEGRHETFLNNPTSAVANAVRTGTDVECGNSYRHLVDAVREGKISEEEIDKSLRRLLIDRFRMGEMDWGKGIVPWDKIDENLLACDASQKLAVRMACESMVLLQNDGLLPLPADGKYFVTGPNAADSICLLGNYNGTPEHAVSALEGITKRVGTLAARSEEADVIIYVGGINPRIEGEEMHGVVLEGFYKGDRTSIELPRAQREEVA
ncbi:MAG: glycoside hydrolase family 3 C-terminal domain-containing protein, partial [Bacteroidales bacterium]|nr:glycoside hydrolase family 3 C-terminal domain-containing protein [Bacteroidales bacterium]